MNLISEEGSFAGAVNFLWLRSYYIRLNNLF